MLNLNKTICSITKAISLVNGEQIWSYYGASKPINIFIRHVLFKIMNEKNSFRIHHMSLYLLKQ